MEAGYQKLRPNRDSTSRFRSCLRIFLEATPKRLNHHPTGGLPNLLRHPIALQGRAGILTCLPSTTPLGLALGSDSPSAENRCAGTLGLTATGFFTRLIVTHVSIRTSDTSSSPYEPPSQAYRTLLYRAYCYAPVASVYCLAPLHLPRGPTRPVSYYAFFK